MAWYDSSWTKRIKITIDHTQLGGSLSNYPVYVDLSDLPSGFWDIVKNGGGDIRVTTSDETTEVAREIVKCDTTTSQGEIHFNGLSLSDSIDTDFYIYFGNSSVSDYATNATYGAENVWDSDFIVVAHLSESSGHLIDSTGNSNDSTSESITNRNVSQQPGQGASFEATNSNYAVLPYTGMSSVVGTVELIINPDDLSARSFWSVNSTYGGGGDNFHIQIYTTTLIMRWGKVGDDQSITATTYLTAGANTYLVSAWDSTSGLGYIDGVQRLSKASPALAGTLTGNMVIGAWYDNARNANADISEFRLSKIKRSAIWISATNINLKTPSSFYTVGSVETNVISYVSPFPSFRR